MFPSNVPHEVKQLKKDEERLVIHKKNKDNKSEKHGYK